MRPSSARTGMDATRFRGAARIQGAPQKVTLRGNGLDPVSAGKQLVGGIANLRTELRMQASRIASIGGAGIGIIANYRSTGTARCRIASIGGTGIRIITNYRGSGASECRIATIDRTGIHIIANYRGSGASG